MQRVGLPVPMRSACSPLGVYLIQHKGPSVRRSRFMNPRRRCKVSRLVLADTPEFLLVKQSFRKSVCRCMPPHCANHPSLARSNRRIKQHLRPFDSCGGRFFRVDVVPAFETLNPDVTVHFVFRTTHNGNSVKLLRFQHLIVIGIPAQRTVFSSVCFCFFFDQIAPSRQNSNSGIIWTHCCSPDDIAPQPINASRILLNLRSMATPSKNHLGNSIYACNSNIGTNLYSVNTIVICIHIYK